MTVARETPTFIYRNSLDLTGFIDGTGNPEPEDQHDRAIIPDGQPGAGGSFCIAQRWVHDLNYFNSLSLDDQEALFGRKKADSSTTVLPGKSTRNDWSRSKSSSSNWLPLTVTVTTQNAGMSSLCLTVNCDRPVPQSIVMVPIRPTNVLFGLTVKPSVALPLPDELSSTIQLTSLVAVHPHVPDGRLIVRLDCVPA